MFWKKLILINASFLVIILQLISLYLKTFENTEAKVNIYFLLFDLISIKNLKFLYFDF